MSLQHITLTAAFTHFWKWTEMKNKPFCCTSSVSSTCWRSNISIAASLAVIPSKSCTGAKPWCMPQHFVMTNTKGIAESLYCYAKIFCASRWERDHLGSLLWGLKPCLQHQPVTDLCAWNMVSFLRPPDLAFICALPREKERKCQTQLKWRRNNCPVNTDLSPAFLFIQGFKEHISTLDKQCKRVTSTLVTERNR